MPVGSCCSLLSSTPRTTRSSARISTIATTCLDMAGSSKGALFRFEIGRLVTSHQIGFSEREVRELHALLGKGTFAADLLSHGHVALVPSALVPTELGQVHRLGGSLIWRDCS
jgi:hypothetical protein